MIECDYGSVGMGIKINTRATVYLFRWGVNGNLYNKSKNENHPVRSF